MCGIAGILGLDHRESIVRLESMLATMPYRGPNDRGTFQENGVTLGHLRLSIIDTSSVGHQPMESYDGRFVIIFNGEIFNYIEVRTVLQSRGATFKTSGDTEVIMEAYRVYGRSCVQHFNGMWAFALYDRESQEVFCSRDRFGVKPFYYSYAEGVLAFASEMKALRHTTSDIDWSYLYAFFDRKTPLGCDRTVYRGIKHLRPGHSLLWSKGRMIIERYWKPDMQHYRQSFDYADPVATVRSLFTSAVQLRLRSDVPVGVCLSGGIDSSAIAMTVKSLGVAPETFSCVYDEPAYSERSYINVVNEATGASSHTITPTATDFFPALSEIVRHHDEPVRMPGVFSHWKVMQCAHGHVTVLLDGQGADEVFGGYTDYFASYIASLFHAVLHCSSPVDAVLKVRRCLNGIEENLGNASGILREALLRAFPLVRMLGRRQQVKDRLFTDGFRAKSHEPLYDDCEETTILSTLRSPLKKEMYRTFIETNLPMLLRYEDRNSMAFSMEARTPFLDYRLVEYALGLEEKYLLNGYTTKWVIREAMKNILPPAIYERKDKRGFPTPVALWFRGPLKDELTRRITQGSYLDLDLVKHTEVQRILDEHLSGAKNHERTLFRLLTLDEWLRMSSFHA